MSDAQGTRFVIGNSFFKRNRVEAPASTTASDGLDPDFIARSCADCHALDGRGAPPKWRNTLRHEPENTVALLLRLSVPSVAGAKQGVVPEPTCGDPCTTRPSMASKPKAGSRYAASPFMAALPMARATPWSNRSKS